MKIIENIPMKKKHAILDDSERYPVNDGL